MRLRTDSLHLLCAGLLGAGAALWPTQVLAAEGDKPAPAAAAPAAAAAPDAAPEPETIGAEDIDIIVHGEPVKGHTVLPATETKFKFKHKETGVIMEFRWAELEESERRRVQKLYGIEMSDDRKVFGPKIPGIKYLLESGKTIEGIRIQDRDQPGRIALKTATSPLLMIQEAEIKSSEPIERYESEFYSALEVYERWLLEKPPGNNDASAHLKLAKDAANIGLYGKAIDHLTQAGIIDPRTKERNEEFQAQIAIMYAEQQVKDLYDQMLRYMNAGDYFDALDALRQLDSNFPNSTYKSRWDTLRTPIEVGCKTEQNKRIVCMSYRVADDLLQRRLAKKVRVDLKNNPVPSIPGKLVTTRKGDVFRGILLGSGDNGGEGVTTSANDDKTLAASSTKSPSPSIADDIQLKCGETTLTISGKDIVSIMDVDLSVCEKEVEPTFDELKDYVTDVSSPDGLKMEMIKKIAKTTKLSEAKVKEVFDNRLKKEAKYEDGILTSSVSYASAHDASYGKGSWLREGAKFTPSQKNDKNAAKVSWSYQKGANGQWSTVAQRVDPKDQENADETDDPLVWWKAQNSETRLAVLRGMMAEKVFKKIQVQNIACSNCGAKGFIVVTAIGGNAAPERCPDCRGMGISYKIVYH